MTAILRHESSERGIIVKAIDAGRLWTPTEFRTWLSGQTKGLRNSRIEFMPNVESPEFLHLVIECDVPAESHGEVLIPHRFAPLGIMGAVTTPAAKFDTSRCVCGKERHHPVHTFHG